MPAGSISGTAGSSAPLAVVVVPIQGRPIVVDARDGRTQRTLAGPREWSTSVVDATWEPARRRVAVLDTNHDVRLLSPDGLADDDTTLQRDWYRTAWTPAGQCVAGTTGSPSTIVGSETAGSAEITIDRIDAMCDVLAVSPDGGELAAGGDSVLHVTPIARRGVPRPTGSTKTLALGDSFGGLFAAAWSPDGRRLVVGSKKGNIQVLDAATGAALRTLPGHRGGVIALSWSADGRVVISADEESVRLSDALTQVALDTLTPGWTIRAAALAGSPDTPDRWLVVCGDSPTALPSADGTPGHGRLLVVDLGR